MTESPSQIIRKASLLLGGERRDSEEIGLHKTVSFGGAWHSEEEGEETLLTNPNLGLLTFLFWVTRPHTQLCFAAIWPRFGLVNRVSSSSSSECHATPNDTVLRRPISEGLLFFTWALLRFAPVASCPGEKSLLCEECLKENGNP